ncbi:PIG-L deacetylase family protein [Nitrosarchaeum koreense]|uniref:LmbE family protein n=1 Tax=Nitrosarchaeum koreense MY1 TaxID=1001994 RepID=F9CY87_9ARCH|nr:PIG-L family deacetylase [Nitrosarchaeum koreense]EGP92865.1 LmbE family protein [Nitrosarchaeum koreense MY1]
MNILAIGAHWDDIELGCGLTLKKLREKGHNIFSVVVCSSQYGKDENEGMKESEALEYGLKSFELIGADYIPTDKEPNSKLAYNKKIMQILEGIANTKKIDAVFTHWFGDLNTDHKATWEISRTAFRNVKNFLMYQSNSYGDNVNIFTPNLFFSFNQESYLFKEKILSQYVSEWARREIRWKREIFERERYWGHISGNDYAEGFQVGKIVDFFV